MLLGVYYIKNYGKMIFIDKLKSIWMVIIKFDKNDFCMKPFVNYNSIVSPYVFCMLNHGFPTVFGFEQKGFQVYPT